jgi:hypothetical protein
MLRVDGRRHWNGAQIRGNGPMRIENGGVIGWNGGIQRAAIDPGNRHDL